MTKDILKSLMFKSGEPDVTLYTPAKNQNLTFETIKSYFINYGLKINNDDFKQKNVEIGRTKYGKRCLVSSVNDVLDYIESLNQTRVKISGHEREERKYFNFDCFKEAWLNAVVHNRWVNGGHHQWFIFLMIELKLYQMEDYHQI